MLRSKCLKILVWSRGEICIWGIYFAQLCQLVKFPCKANWSESVVFQQQVKSHLDQHFGVISCFSLTISFFMSISRNRLVGHCTTHLFLFLMWLCLSLFPISFNGILGMVAEAELLGPVEPKLRSRTFGSAGGVSELCFCCCGETPWLKVTLLLLFYSSPIQYTLTWVSSPSTPSSSSLSSSFPQT